MNNTISEEKAASGGGSGCGDGCGVGVGRTEAVKATDRNTHTTVAITQHNRSRRNIQSLWRHSNFYNYAMHVCTQQNNNNTCRNPND